MPQFPITRKEFEYEHWVDEEDEEEFFGDTEEISWNETA